jgi:hypothetical protein
MRRLPWPAAPSHIGVRPRAAKTGRSIGSAFGRARCEDQELAGFGWSLGAGYRRIDEHHVGPDLAHLAGEVIGGGHADHAHLHPNRTPDDDTLRDLGLATRRGAGGCPQAASSPRIPTCVCPRTTGRSPAEAGPAQLSSPLRRRAPPVRQPPTAIYKSGSLCRRVAEPVCEMWRPARGMDRSPVVSPGNAKLGLYRNPEGAGRPWRRQSCLLRMSASSVT